MLSYISSFFDYFSVKKTDEDDHDKEDFLARELVDLEAENEQIDDNTKAVATTAIPRNVDCFQRTGVITYITEDYILIDGMLYFDITACTQTLHLKDKVLYLGYKKENDSAVVVRILENYGIFWGNEDEAPDEDGFQVIEHVIVGEVDHRQERFVYMKDSDLKFSLDDVQATFIPLQGDWLELKCTVQYDENKPFDISATQVLKVMSFKALRRKIKGAVVTYWTGEYGTCDKQIYFNKQILQNGGMPRIGSKVIVEAVESNQGTCTWRAIKLVLNDTEPTNAETDTPNQLNEEEKSLEIEKQKEIQCTHPLIFENVDFKSSAQLTLSVTNNSDQVYVMNKWLVLNKKRDSQINIKPLLTRPTTLYPKTTFNFTITCHPKFLGNAKECLVIMFRGFQVKRFVEINVNDSAISNGNGNSSTHNLLSENDRIAKMRNIRKNEGSFVPGVRAIKPPAFISVRLDQFPIPQRIWTAVLGDSDQTMHTSDFKNILHRIETHLPCLSQDFNAYNYIDKWHALLYMEEIQANINMRVYDLPKAFLIRCQEYIGIEIRGLAERRPSLICGDRVLVKDMWNTETPQYEGFIHQLRGDLVLMKFNANFHETYSGSDVSIEFHLIRTPYRRAHRAVNLALSNLGPDVLFPSRVLLKPPQVTPEELKCINWFNQDLNPGQKAAVTNILLGESRPMPYCIFGPPGTGKTMTVIETILQILTLVPDSRILVASSSNSAANLVTERLIENRKDSTDSILRLIANHVLQSDNIPEIIKPFCGTLDPAVENTRKSRYGVKDGMHLNCPASFVGRHRVTIGTCNCVGTLVEMGLPKGHFTHVIIDEAGQATEPEIMIALTFVDKESGQIILAGDPLQLGPVVMSKYCVEFGMDESYLCRLLETFPYQRDFDSFADGYNKRLVTRLNINYRSLEEVLKLPNEMFYDGCLVSKINREKPWILKILQVISELFESPDSSKGGIYVYGIKGCNARAQDSPSWYNPQEAAMVALTTCKLYKKNITVDDIGIITPYISQVKYLRLVFDSMGLPQPKIGSVEEFQGQERPVILISTVRSSESLLQNDLKYTLGFVRNPKRLNVALTRAQVAVILFCNPHLLTLDPLWKKVVTQAVDDGNYVGCDLPQCYDSV